MKKLLIVLMIMVYPFFSCAGQENQSLFISNEKFTLRYSTRSDIEKILGKPQEIKYFERGGEDFFWKNFTVCSYDESRLRFHYDQDGAIIRMTVNAGYSGKVRFLEKDIKSIIKEDILNLVKTFENKNDYRGTYISDKYIDYDFVLPGNSVITYGFWFDTSGKTTWIDFYYTSPW